MNQTSFTIAGAIAVPRGCGEREEDGIYWELGTGAGGNPLEDFLIDPPFPIEGVSALGVTWHQHEETGVWHLIDWIGSQYWPNPADWLEEVRRFGVSSRLPSTLEFERLTPESRLLIVHAHGFLENAHELLNFQPAPAYRCPLVKDPHSPGEHCASLHWLTLEREEGDDHPQMVERQMPSFHYKAQALPPGFAPKWRPAVIASFPCSRLVVVAGEKTEDRLAAMQKSTLPTAVVDQ